MDNEPKIELVRKIVKGIVNEDIGWLGDHLEVALDLTNEEIKKMRSILEVNKERIVSSVVEDI